MPVKVKQAYEANTNAGDAIADADVLPFEQDLAGNASNSWGSTFLQLTNYLATKFYRRSESDVLLGGKIPLVPSPTLSHGVVQTASGALSSTGLPMAVIDKNTVQVSNWAQNNHTLAAHGLSVIPDLVHITGVFVANHAPTGWLQGQTVSLAAGNVGDAVNPSSLVIDMDNTNFQIYNSCASSNAILIPNKLSGTDASVAVGSAVLRLDITFMTVQP